MTHSFTLDDYDIIKQQLDKVSSPFFKLSKEIEEKIVARSILLATLQDHRSQKTLPQGILPMKQPQLPACMEEIFTAQFKAINKRACNEILNLMIETRQAEIVKIQEELSKNGSNMEFAVTECLSHIAISAQLEAVAKSLTLKKYYEELSTRMRQQKKKVITAGALDSYQNMKKKEEFAASNLEKAM